jgi:hypothetical protein
MVNQVDLKERIRIIRRLGQGEAVYNRAHNGSTTSDLVQDRRTVGLFGAGK